MVLFFPQEMRETQTAVVGNQRSSDCLNRGDCCMAASLHRKAHHLNIALKKFMFGFCQKEKNAAHI